MFAQEISSHGFLMWGFNRAQKKELAPDSGVNQIALFLEGNPLILNHVAYVMKEIHTGTCRIEVSVCKLAWLFLGFLGGEVEIA